MTAPHLNESSQGFQEWWDHVHRAVSRALRSMPPDIVEDVLQDLALDVLERRQRKHGMPTVAFAVQFAKWRSLDRLRRRKEVALDHAPVQSAAPQQEAAVVLREVQAIVARLPPAQREVIQFWMSGHESQEIARLTGKKDTTIRSLLRHARYRIAMAFGDT